MALKGSSLPKTIRSVSSRKTIFSLTEFVAIKLKNVPFDLRSNTLYTFKVLEGGHPSITSKTVVSFKLCSCKGVTLIDHQRLFLEIITNARYCNNCRLKQTETDYVLETTTQNRKPIKADIIDFRPVARPDLDRID